MASTLRTAIRTIAGVPSGGQALKAAPDPATVKKIVAALTTIWNVLEKAWPRFQKWFRAGLTEEEWTRFRELGNKLPSVTAEERQELVALVRRGLRLEKQSAGQTEDELPDDELDAPVQPA